MQQPCDTCGNTERRQAGPFGPRCERCYFGRRRTPADAAWKPGVDRPATEAEKRAYRERLGVTVDGSLIEALRDQVWVEQLLEFIER